VIISHSSCFSSPRIQFEKNSHDFGELAQEMTVKEVFIFKNTGNSLLIIGKIESGWGCTGALLTQKEIPAGGEGKIEVSLSTGQRSGDIIKNIVIHTNDPKNKKVKLTLKAFIVEDGKKINIKQSLNKSEKSAQTFTLKKV
jgi:hypothetical protein